jgi:hypothetical protein
MDDFKTTLAKAVSPMLDAFQSIGAAPLQRVAYSRVHGCVARIAFDFASKSLVAVAHEDDDTVTVSVENTHATDPRPASDVSALWPWAHFIGKPFGWGYVVVNQQGYCDGLLLSFDGIRPRVLLQVIASSFQVNAISYDGA